MFPYDNHYNLLHGPDTLGVRTDIRCFRIIPILSLGTRLDKRNFSRVFFVWLEIGAQLPESNPGPHSRDLCVLTHKRKRECLATQRSDLKHQLLAVVLVEVMIENLSALSHDKHPFQICAGLSICFQRNRL